jgi:glycosyltransferase involved in cell wall biosynthesis
MRIAVNTRLLLENTMEGIARYNYESLKRMVAAHPEDSFYFIFDRPYSKNFILGENVHPIVLFPPTRHPILMIYWFEWAVYRLFKKLKPDVFLSGDTYLSLRTKVPTLLVCHDLAYLHYPDHIPFSHRLYYRYFFPKFHSKAAEIIAVSQFTKNDIIQQYGISAGKITVAYNAGNRHFYPIPESTQLQIRQDFTDGKPYFVYLGSIHPRKNIENLIKGFELFKSACRTDHKLVILGRLAWNTGTFLKTWNQSPFKQDIIQTQIPRKDLPRYIGSAEALCYVSLFEGFGIPIVEGFEAGVPVITSNVSSMPEVAGNAALLVDPHDPESIKSAMYQVATSPELRKNLVGKGFQRLKDFRWEKTAEILYEKLVKIKKDRPK